MTDVEGREYVDLVGAWGPALLGHAHPEVIAAVAQAAQRGLGFGAASPGETDLVDVLRERVPALERVRLVSTGTEATMTAIRLARGVTGRPLLVKFAGHYHGHSDALLAEAGSGIATLGLPGSAGVTAETAAQTLVLPYNDTDAVIAVFAEHGPRIAAVIVEAAAANMGVVAPAPGFNAFLAEQAHANGALLILDEVLTGFRVGPGGWWGLEARARDADEYRPDLVTFGKVIGGGLPLAAIGGRAEVMDALAPLGRVYQAGTLSGNPVAVAAGLATLRLADSTVYARVDEVSQIVADAASAAFQAAGSRMSSNAPETCSRSRFARPLLETMTRCATKTAIATPRSSTRCSRRACHFHRRCSRRGSSRQRTTTVRWPGFSTHFRRPRKQQRARGCATPSA